MELDLEPMIDDVCNHLGVDSCLIKSIIATESAWNPQAESPFARGLMQISKIALLEVNARYRLNYSYDDMFDPRKNVEVGALYFKRLYNYYLTKYPFNPFALNYAIMAYNFGIGIVNNWLKNTKPDNGYIDEFIPKETREHLLDVMWWYAYYKNRKYPPVDK